jgi:hypothetical protein
MPLIRKLLLTLFVATVTCILGYSGFWLSTRGEIVVSSNYGLETNHSSDQYAASGSFVSPTNRPDRHEGSRLEDTDISFPSKSLRLASVTQSNSATGAVSSALEAANEKKTSRLDQKGTQNTSENISKSDYIGKRIKAAKANFLDKLQKAELRRCTFKSKNFEGFTWTWVIINKPNDIEVAGLQSLLYQESLKLDASAAPYFMVDGQRLLDHFTHFGDETHLIVYVHMADGVHPSDTTGQYWEFKTSQPEAYGVSAEGQIAAPEGVITYYSKPWLVGWVPPERYRHLFKLR